MIQSLQQINWKQKTKKTQEWKGSELMKTLRETHELTAMYVSCLDPDVNKQTVTKKWLNRGNFNTDLIVDIKELP